MKFVEWCDLFVIGNKTIDDQHQVLLEIANTFHNEAKKGFNRKVTNDTMNQLIDYAQKHFFTEETITGKLDLPIELLDNHNEIHEKLIMDIYKIHEDLSSGKINSMYDIEKFLTDWLILHILIEDKKYKEYLHR